MPTLSYEVSFSATQALTSGSIRVTDTTDWAGQGIDPADVEIGWGFQAPDGNVYAAPATGESWNIFPDTQEWEEFPLPQSSDLTVQQGDYIVTVIYYIGGPVDSGTYEPDATTHNLCTDTPTLCIETNANCLNLVVSATDDTEWEDAGWTVDSRAMTLQYPSSTFHADITGAGPTISTSGEPIWSGTWTATTTVTVTKDGFTTTLTTVKQFQVSCDLDGCRLVCMLKNKYADYEKAWARGDQRRVDEIKADLAQMSWLSVMIQGSIGCGDDTFVDTLITKFKQVGAGGNSAGCECCDDCTEPRMLVPIWGSSGTMWTPVAGPNMTITPGVNTYTFAVSTSFANLVGSLYNTEVVSTDSSVNVTDSTVGIVKTFDLEVAKVMPDYMEFLWIISDTTGAVAALGTPTVVGTTFKIPGSITPSGNLYIFGNLMLGSAVAFNVDVEIVNPILRTPYSLTHRDHPMIRAEVINNTSTTQFTVGIIAENGLFGTDDGKAHLIEWFDRVLASFTLLFKLTKRTV